MSVDAASGIYTPRPHFTIPPNCYILRGFRVTVFLSLLCYCSCLLHIRLSRYMSPWSTYIKLAGFICFEWFHIVVRVELEQKEGRFALHLLIMHNLHPEGNLLGILNHAGATT